jgi:predicted nucleic acid-binding protein
MYLLGRYGGFPAQEALWDYVEDSLLLIHVGSDEEAFRIRELMRRYRDTPMDLADASLVAAAEALGALEVFTLDSHFHAYRASGTQPFQVSP